MESKSTVPVEHHLRVVAGLREQCAALQKELAECKRERDRAWYHEERLRECLGEAYYRVEYWRTFYEETRSVLSRWEAQLGLSSHESEERAAQAAIASATLIEVDNNVDAAIEYNYREDDPYMKDPNGGRVFR